MVDVESFSPTINLDLVKGKKALSTFRTMMSIDNTRKVESEVIEIESTELRELFLRTARHISPYIVEREILFIYSPFKDFIWSWTALSDACNIQEDDHIALKDARDDLRRIMDLLKSSTMKPYFQVRTDLVASRTIPFDWLWVLFPPSQKVYTKSFLGEYQMFEVQKTDWKTDSGPFRLWLAAYDWDGEQFVRYSYMFSIPKFDGQRPVESLACFPIDYYKSGQVDAGLDLRRALIERGRKFCDLCSAEEGNFQFQYDGLAMSDTTGVDRLTSSKEVGLLCQVCESYTLTSDRPQTVFHMQVSTGTAPFSSRP